MKIKLSQSDWRRIGEQMGWMKTAQWGGRSDDGPPDPEEGEKLNGETVDVEMEDMEVPEFPGVLFGGTYTIMYDYEFPVRDEGDDEVNILDISVKEVLCTHVAQGAECPSEDKMEAVKGAIKKSLMNPKNGYPHEDDVREDARSKDPRHHEDPDLWRKERDGF